jgi:sulfite reductase (NADPH) flavoprotein alpha-component
VKATNPVNQLQLTPLTSPLDERQLARLQTAVADLSALQVAWVSGYLAGLGGLTVAANPVVAPAPEPGLTLTILYGSQTGNARAVAESLAGLVRARGAEPRLVSMADYRPRDLARERLLLLVVSTQGEGEPPESARELHGFLHGQRAPRLDGLRYGVLGLGDSSYEHFCKTAKDFEGRLRALGGQPLLDPQYCDLNFQAAASAWSQQALERAAEHLGQREARIIQMPGTRPAPSTPPDAALSPTTEPLTTRLLENRPLTTQDAVGEVRHLAFAIDPAALRYAPGDALGVWFRNDPALVDAVLDATGLPGDAALTMDGADSDLREALSGRLELTQLHPTVVKAWAGLVGSAPLAALCEDPARLRDYAGGRQFIDLLAEHPGRPDAAALAGLLHPLRPRLYSIASSQAEFPDEVHLTVALVNYRVAGQERLGGASGFLTRRLAEDAPVRVQLGENQSFRLPRDGAAPVIMVAAGTGVAPFRAFLQQRAATGARGRNWLLFGNRNFRRDFLYQLDWQAHRKSGVLSRVNVAFSRDQADKRYVQHRLIEQGRDLYAWLQEGAHLYVCGSTAMGRAVHESLLGLIAAQTGGDREDAVEQLDGLRRDGRYQRDLY